MCIVQKKQITVFSVSKIMIITTGLNNYAILITRMDKICNNAAVVVLVRKLKTYDT